MLYGILFFHGIPPPSRCCLIIIKKFHICSALILYDFCKRVKLWWGKKHSWLGRIIRWLPLPCLVKSQNTKSQQKGANMNKSREYITFILKYDLQGHQRASLLKKVQIAECGENEILPQVALTEASAGQV